MKTGRPDSVSGAPRVAPSLSAATPASVASSWLECWGMPLFLLALFCLFLQFAYLLFWAPGKGLHETAQMEAAVIEQKVKNQRLANRNTSLKSEIAALKQGLTAVEEHARFKLGMISEDETFFAILNAPEND